MSKCFENRTKTFWTHTQPTKKKLEPKFKWFKIYDQIFKINNIWPSNQSIYGLALKPK